MFAAVPRVDMPQPPDCVPLITPDVKVIDWSPDTRSSFLSAIIQLASPKTEKAELIVLVSFPTKHSAANESVREKEVELSPFPGAVSGVVQDIVAAPAAPATVKNRPVEIAEKVNFKLEILICSPPMLSK